MDYEWDPKKAPSNLAKHGVDFADAAGALEDEWALTIREENVSGEQRFATMGSGFLGHVLVVIYAYRRDRIRLISARVATRDERRAYERKRI